MSGFEISYREMIELAQEGVWVLDANGLTVFVNQALCDMLGFAQDEMMGASVFSFMSEEWLPEGMRKLERRRSGIIEHFDFQFQRKNGSPLWAIVSAKPMYDEQGRYWGAVGMLNDITERKLAEDAVQQTTNELKHLFQMIPACIYKYRLEDEKLIYLSDSWEQLTGLPREAMLADSRYYMQFLDEGEETRRNNALIYEAMSRLEPYGVTQILHSPLRGTRHTYVSARPAREDGKVYYYGTVIDITQQRLAEEERRLLSMALEQSAEGIVVFNADGSAKYANRGWETLSGQEREAALGRKLTELIGSGNPAACSDAIWQAVLQGDIWRGNFVMERASGEQVELHTTMSPVHDAAGRISHGVLVQSDITHELNLERQLRQSERLGSIGQTITGVAHNLKNILIALRGSTAMLDKEIELASLHDGGTIWNVFKRNLERLAALAETMLDYSRMESLQLASHNLNDLVREIMEQTSHHPRFSHIKFAVRLDDKIPPLLCDKEKIYGAILNLLINAADASKPGRMVEISTHLNAEQETCILDVADSGSGIPAENLSKIFDPFFTTKGTDGMGMGLPLTHKVIHEHGGSITVESKPGRTIFSITLPLSQSMQPAPGHGEVEISGKKQQTTSSGVIG